MNNAKMWLVVKPTVGIPLFLSAVAIGSFAVHVAVLSKTNWYEDYLLGNELGTSAGQAALELRNGDTGVANASYTLPLGDGAQEITVILPDGTTAKAILQSTEVLASARVSPLVATD